MRVKLGDCAGIVLSEEDRRELKEEAAEWIKEYPWLKKPAMNALLKKTLALKRRIDNLEAWMDNPDNAEYRESAIFLYDKLLQRWKMIMGSMGVTHTAQQYIKSSDRKGQTPEEMLGSAKTKFEKDAKSEKLTN